MIMLYPKYNMLLIRTPGAGSSSFIANLNRKAEHKWLEYTGLPEDCPCLSWSKITNRAHLIARQVRELWPDEYRSHKVVGLIRHPVDWTNSIWRKKPTLEVLGEDNSGSYSDYLGRLRLTPYHWLADETGELMVDEVYRTEDFETTVFPSFGIDPPYSRDTVSSLPKAVPTDDDMKVLRQKFAKEFTHYD